MKKLNILILILCILSLAGQLLLLPKLPDTIPTHWNVSGEIDGYGSKYTSLFLAAIPLLMYGLFELIPRIDPRKQNYEKHQKAYTVVRILTSLLFIALVWATNAAAMGIPVDMGLAAPVGVGLLLLAIGNYMPQIRPNYSFGIRTPWTLESPYVWKKTHTAGGVLFCIYGLLLIAAGIVQKEWMMNLFLAVLLLGIVALTLYSWLLFRREQTK